MGGLAPFPGEGERAPGHMSSWQNSLWDKAVSNKRSEPALGDESPENATRLLV